MVDAPPPAARERSERTRQQILDAAVICVERLGATKTSVTDIIKASGVGRTTLYRYFKNLEQIMAAAVLRDIQQFIVQLEQVIDAQTTIDGQIIEGVLFCIQDLSTRPVLAMMIQQQAADLVSKIALEEQVFYDLGAKFCEPVFTQAHQQGRIRDGVDLAQFVEWNTRIIISLLTSPSDLQHQPDQLRAYLQRFLLPSLMRDSVSL